MNDDTTALVQDAEVITETDDTTQTSTPQTATPSMVPPDTATPAFDIAAYNAVLEIVRRRLTIIESAQVELKKLKEMSDDILLNDEAYQLVEKANKEVQNKKKEVKGKILKLPQVAELNGKMKDLKEQMKDNLESLSDELMEYYRTSGVTEIEDADGNVREFSISIRLKPQKRSEG